MSAGATLQPSEEVSASDATFEHATSTNRTTPEQTSITHDTPEQTSITHDTPEQTSITHDTPEQTSITHDTPEQTSITHDTPEQTSITHDTPEQTSITHDTPEQTSITHDTPEQTSITHDTPEQNFTSPTPPSSPYRLISFSPCIEQPLRSSSPELFDFTSSDMDISKASNTGALQSCYVHVSMHIMFIYYTQMLILLVHCYTPHMQIHFYCTHRSFTAAANAKPNSPVRDESTDTDAALK